MTNEEAQAFWQAFHQHKRGMSDHITHNHFHCGCSQDKDTVLHLVTQVSDIKRLLMAFIDDVQAKLAQANALIATNSTAIFEVAQDVEAALAQIAELKALVEQGGSGGGTPEQQAAVLAGLDSLAGNLSGQQEALSILAAAYPPVPATDPEPPIVGGTEG